MSALRDHVSDQQATSARLCDLLEILYEITGDKIAPNAHTSLVEVVRDMALRLNAGLDCINLPED